MNLLVSRSSTGWPCALSTRFDGKRTIVDDCGYVGEVRESHAAFIVHACNAYPELVEALKEAKTAIETTEEWNGELTMINHDYVRSLDDALSGCFQIIGAILSKLGEDK